MKSSTRHLPFSATSSLVKNQLDTWLTLSNHNGNRYDEKGSEYSQDRYKILNNSRKRRRNPKIGRGFNKINNNSNNRSTRQHQQGRFSHHGHSNNSNNNDRRRRPLQRKQQLSDRQIWLRKTTKDILETDPGSLVKGKWHELVSMMRGWSKYSKDDSEAPVVIERLLKRLLDERSAGNEEAKADIELYNILLDSWACSAIFRTREPYVASQRAREILVSLQENFEADQDSSLKPNFESFGIVFDAVLKAEGPTKARRVLAWMEYLVKMDRNDCAKPTRRQYIILLDAYANSRASNAGQLAEGFIRHMKITGERPDTLCYNIAIKAWTRSKRGRQSAEHADRILEEMDVEKDLITYSSVISAWATSGMRAHAVARAEELLRCIEETPGIEPNTVVINSVMSTWVKSKIPAAVNRTAELLEEMKELDSAQPDLISYNTHIHALAVHGKRPGYAQRANDMLAELEEMSKNKKHRIRPNLFSYNTVIDAWSKSLEYDAAWKAVKVLRRLFDEDIDSPNPDYFSFNQVLSALSKSTKPGAALLAERLLTYMEDAHRMQIYDNARPDVISYTAVIVALARCDDEDAPDRAELLFNRMKDRYASGEQWMKPNRRCYNALIDAWAKSGKGTFAARKAEALLTEMTDLFEQGDDTVSPNVVTYNAVLNAWARSGTRCCANKAEEYLDRLWELYNSGDGELGPNDKSFNTVSRILSHRSINLFCLSSLQLLILANSLPQVINAISKSQNKSKAQKALRILRRMDKLYQGGYKDARPNEVTYTSVLNSCAFPATLDQLTRRKALSTAQFTLQELQASRYGQPNEVTYGTFLKACGNLLTDDDEMLRVVIEEAFRQCCKDGQVGEMVLSYLRETAPEDLYRELLAEVEISDSLSIEELPSEWSCNVREENRRRDSFYRQSPKSVR